MKVNEIIVSAGRTFNHPYEQYANLKPHVTLKATLEDGDDVRGATQQLQATAEELVEQHKATLLSEIKRLYRLREQEQELANLAARIRDAQAEINHLREENPDLAPLIAGALASGETRDGEEDL